MVEVLKGNLFDSGAQTLVNTVNTVGVMGKGVALEFRKRFPEMYEDYLERCARHAVRLGRPYLYRSESGAWILNFPTKQHWRSVSRLDDIVDGLLYLEQHYREWGIESLAVPPLGCGNGQLEWRVVGPVLYRHLQRLAIPVKLYAPPDAGTEQLSLPFLERAGDEGTVAPGPVGRGLDPAWVGIAVIVDRIHRQLYRAPIGRVMFQKLAYFASVAGLPISLEFGRGSFGPFAPGLKAVTTRLVNNGVLVERESGRSLVVEPGPTYALAARTWERELARWNDAIERVVDLFMRIRQTRQAEIAATVHFATQQLQAELGRFPSEREVFEAVSDWKRRHAHPPSDAEIAEAIRNLNILGWISIPVSDDLPVEEDDELLYA